MCFRSRYSDGPHHYERNAQTDRPGSPTSLEWPDGIVLTLEPLADCQRYDHLLGETHAH
ncbi:hypothetical protein [Mycoavidus cysteinexigens]|uniref:hypothetical protein n=1 Tax=Mycoavidus cysteinexigens TaxID=1553431 RepID=UPI0013755738|nr:hypothetical protein [Mycoavidus cysteinexigens]